MRGRVFVAVLCALFLMIGSVAYSAPNHKAKNGVNSKKVVKKHRAMAKQSRTTDSITSDNKKGRRTLATSHKNKHTGKKHLARKKLNHTPIEVDAGEQDPEFTEYRVQKGDTVERIAEKFNVDRQDIVDLNAVKNAKLAPGAGWSYRKRARKTLPLMSR